MSMRAISEVLIVAGIGMSMPALADHSWDEGGYAEWEGGKWKEEFWDGPCEVKLESKLGEFKREVECKDGIGAHWHGEWKREFWDGPCKVKLEATHEKYKEEVECEE